MVNIGANIVNLNTANPAIRFAGLNIFDSGSIGGSGSFLYDSVQDEMIFVHRGDNTNITSSVVMMGPQTYNNIGSETYPTTNRILKGTGNEHIGDSCIIDDGTTTCIKNNLVTTGTACFGGQVCTPTGTFTYNAGQPAINVRSSDINFALMSILGNQAGDVNWLLMSGYPNAGDFTIRQSDVVNALTIKKTSGIASFNGAVCAPNLLISNCATIGTVGFSYPEFRLAVTPIMTVVGAGGTSTGEGIYFKRTSDLCQGGWISGNGGALYIIGQNKHSTSFGDIYFATNNGTTTCDIMVISGANQRVGIGTPTPIDKLEVVGGIHTSGTASDSKSCTGYLDYYVGQVRLGITGPNTTTPAIFRIDQYSSNASVSRTPFYINANGCVGIGTVTPKMHLTFADGIYQRILLNDNANNYSIGVANSVAGGDAMIKFIAGCSASGCGEVGFYSSSDLRFLIKKDGDLVSCGTGGFIMTQGTTAQRPTAVTGTMRYNSTFNLMEFYNGTSWVQMGSGDLATAQCINNTSMCHSVYQVAGTTGLQGAGSGCISLFGAAAPSMATTNSGFQFATHGGHCGISDYPGYWAVHLGGARAVNQLKAWIHSNSWGYFELQGSNNSGNASGFNQSGNWTTLSFLCSTNNNCQNMGGNASGCSDGVVFTYWYTNNVPFSAYRIKVLDSSRPNQAIGSIYGGSAGYVWQLNRV
jgi:hypothetical protein